MKKIIINNLWWVTFLISVALLGVHSFQLTDLNVDSTSILLLIIILISPFVASIKKIKYGDFEAEIDPKEIEKIKSEAVKNIEPKSADEELRPEVYIATDAIRNLAVSDSVMALAKIRIELEKVLSHLARITSLETKNKSLGALVKSLTTHEFITPHLGKSLTEVIGICNRAIHGESISEESAQTIVELGIELLEDIYWDVQEQITSGTILKEETIDSKEMSDYYEKKYLLTTLVPLTKNPRKVTREVTQEQLENLLEYYHQYAEFIIELKEIPKNG